MSATYNYYANEFGGEVLSEKDFPFAIKRATLYLDSLTMGRINDELSHDILDRVYMAECAIAEKMFLTEKASETIATGGAEVSSESVGSYSRTFRSKSEIMAEAQIEMRLIAVQYLGVTGLMYRGIPCTLHT